MAFSHEEWLRLQRVASLKRDAERVPQFKMLAQAEVGAGELTRHSAWNWFLQILAAEKELAERSLAEIDAQARVSTDFSHEGLARVQAVRHAWHSRIVTLGEVMALPSQIVDDSKQAKAKLESLNRAETNGKSDRPAAS